MLVLSHLIETRSPLPRQAAGHIDTGYSRADACRFIAVFTLTYVVMLAALAVIPDVAREGISRATCAAARSAAGSFGFEAACAGTLLTVSGFTIGITFECAVPRFPFLFAAAVIAYPRRPWREKAWGVLVGGVFLFALNLARILLMALVGASAAPWAFEFSHVYLFRSLLVLSTFVVWWAWGRHDEQARPLLRFAGMAILLSAVFHALLQPWSQQYLAVVACSAQKILGLFGSFPSFHASQPGITVTWSGGIVFLPLNVLDSSLFFALVVASATRRTLRRVALQMGLGSIVLPLLHLAVTIAATIALGVLGAAPPPAPLLWVVRSVSVAAPIVLWLLLRRAFAIVRNSGGTAQG